jgi:hypothetical protein
MSVVMAVFTMSDAIAAWGRLAKFAIQESLYRFSHGSAGAGCDLDAQLLEKADSPIAHSTAEHHVRPLLTNELGNHSRLVGLGEGVEDDLYGLDFMAVYIYEGVVGATSKMVAGAAIETCIRLGADSNSHSQFSLS